MAIPILQYKGHEIHAYVQQKFPLHKDPYAVGPRRYSAVIRIDDVPFDDSSARRYSTEFVGDNPTRDIDAVDLAMQFGRDIIDGKIQSDDPEHR